MRLTQFRTLLMVTFYSSFDELDSCANYRTRGSIGCWISRYI